MEDLEIDTNNQHLTHYVAKLQVKPQMVGWNPLMDTCYENGTTLQT